MKQSSAQDMGKIFANMPRYEAFENQAVFQAAVDEYFSTEEIDLESHINFLHHQQVGPLLEDNQGLVVNSI